MQDSTRYLSAAFVFILLLGSQHRIYAQSLVNSTILDNQSPSIVLVEARGLGTTWTRATGFVWISSEFVATAYHVVAPALAKGGRIRVFFNQRSGGGFSLAKVKAASEESDLAILKLSSPYSDIEPLNPTDALPATNKLTIAGYPLGLKELHSHYLEPSLIQAKSLEAHLPEDQLEEVRNYGVPDLNLDVIAVEGGMLPGYSGAPIFDSDGRVVGIGNGGLERGTVDLGWIVPVARLVELERAKNSDTLLPTANFLDSVNELFGTGPAVNEYILNGSNASLSMEVGLDAKDPLLLPYTTRLWEAVYSIFRTDGNSQFKEYQELSFGYSPAANYRKFELVYGSPLFFDLSSRVQSNSEYVSLAIVSSLRYSFSCYTESGIQQIITGKNDVWPKLTFSVESDFGSHLVDTTSVWYLPDLPFNNNSTLSVNFQKQPIGSLASNVMFGDLVNFVEGYDNIAAFISGGCVVTPYLNLPNGWDDDLISSAEAMLRRARFNAVLDLGTGKAVRFSRMNLEPIGSLTNRNEKLIAWFPRSLSKTR